MSRKKKSCIPRGTVSTLPLCVGFLHLPFPPPFFFSFNQYFLSSCYVLDTILGTGESARNNIEETSEFSDLPNKQLST